MNTLILDECLTELYEAEKCLDMIKEIDAYSEIFEASSPDVHDQIETNEKATNGAIEHLKKAAEAVLNMIRNIISSIKEFFEKRKLNDLEREAYGAFKEACKKDPSLKNKKITVTDYRKLQAEYSNILKEVEEYDRALASGKKTDVEQLAQAITNRLTGIAKGVSVSVSCDAALKMATASRELSKMMLSTLQKDERMQELLVDSIGDKQAKKFQKDLNSLGKRISLKRHWMKKHGQLCESVDEAIFKTFTQVKDLCTNPSFDKLSDNKTIIKGILGNDEVKKTIGDVKDIADYSAGTYVKHEINSGIRETKGKIKNKIAPKKSYDRSAMDAVLGVDNPDSVLNKTANKIGEGIAKRKLKKK